MLKWVNEFKYVSVCATHTDTDTDTDTHTHAHTHTHIHTHTHTQTHSHSSSCAMCSQFDLYSKSDELPDMEALKPYYQSLCDKFCPGVLKW